MPWEQQAHPQFPQLKPQLPVFSSQDMDTRHTRLVLEGLPGVWEGVSSRWVSRPVASL